jgi:MoaA/NifB/PqqE/SkfB family radical SAM enzyme
MPRPAWERAFKVIHDELGLKRFVIDGRSLTAECIWAIKYLKENFGDVKVGLISDGVSAEPFIERLIDFPPDWLDVSVDGLEKEHDFQRSCSGAFDRTVNILHRLKDSNRFEKINLLTCLTNLNIHSVLEMIKFLNSKGFKNFFITPVTVLNGYRPDSSLQPQKEKFVSFLDDLLKGTNGLSDTWLEVDIYEAIYASAIKQLRPNLFSELIMKGEHLELVREYRSNEIHICYYPSSLTGVREFIVNSDGNIIPPKVMAMGKIPEGLIFDNILQFKLDGTLSEVLLNRKAFSFYFLEFLQEKDLFVTT